MTLPILSKPLRSAQTFRRSNALSAKLARGAMLTFALEVGGISLAYLFEVVLARAVGIDAFGTYAYGLSWATFLAVFVSLGFPVALLRFVPELTVKGKLGEVKGLVAGSLLMTFAVSIIVTGLAAGAVLGFGLGSEHGHYVALAIGIGLLPLLVMEKILTSLGRAFKRVFLAYAPTRLGRPLLAFAGIGALVALGWRLDLVAAMLVVWFSLAGAVGIQLWLLLKKIPPHIKSAKAEYRFPAWLSVAFPLLFMHGFLIITKQVDILMIGAFRPPADVGLYRAASKSAIVLSFVLTSVNAVAAPRISALHARGETAKLQALASNVAHLSFWPSLAMAVALVSGGGLILGLFGTEFVAAWGVLSVLALGQLMNAGAGAVGMLANLTGHHRESLRVFGWAALLAVVLNLALIPPLGILGAAIASASVLLFWNVWLHRIVSQRIGVQASIFSTLLRRRRTEVLR